jgi:hypothetical protein
MIRLLIVLALASVPVFAGTASRPASDQSAPPGQPPGQPAPGQPAPGQPTPPRDTRAGGDPQRGTAVLRGTVIAADNSSPLRRAQVRAFAQDGRAGGVVTTDPQGRFEIRELVAGRYTVSASKAGYVPTQFGQRRPDQQGTVLDVLDGQVVEKITIALPRGGVITGRVTDEYGEPIAGVNVSAMRFRYVSGARRLMASGGAGTDDLGAFRIFGLPPGEYFVSGGMRSGMATSIAGAPGAGDVEGFAPTYYPGTPNAAEAMRVTVRAAQETAGLNFALVPTKLVRVSGRVVASNGQPVAGGFVNMRAADPYNLTGMMFGSAQTRPDGSFLMTGVAAGSYVIAIQPRGRATPDAEFGEARITVGGEDLTNIVITTARGATARGIIRTDETDALPVSPQQVIVAFRPLEPEVMFGGTEPRVNGDWSFEIGGLFHRGILSGSVIGSAEWSFKAAYLDGQDITDQPLDFSPGDTIDGLEVVFTRRTTDLSGTVTDRRGQPVLAATVLAFPQDASRWTYLSRHIRLARPDQGGRYQFRGLPPSDYFVVALEDFETGRQTDPDYLETIRNLSTRVSLDEAETKVQNLRLVMPPQ